MQSYSFCLRINITNSFTSMFKMFNRALCVPTIASNTKQQLKSSLDKRINMFRKCTKQMTSSSVSLDYCFQQSKLRKRKCLVLPLWCSPSYCIYGLRIYLFQCAKCWYILRSLIVIGYYCVKI